MLLPLICLSVQSLIIPEAQESKWETLNDYLPNGLEYLLINCKDCSLSSASLSVKVGSKFDNLPGTAHLLEHMIFYSSKSYPEEDYLLKFISLHKGFINAYTSLTLTNFYFSIKNSDFFEALSIFSKPFFEAVLEKEAINREIQAVHSEHMKNVNNDDWLDFRLLQLLMGEDFGKFGTGNNETLSVEGVEKEVKEMYSNFYIGGNMKLVLYGNFQLKDAEKTVFELFQQVPVGNVSEGLHRQGYQRKLALRKRLADGCSFDVFFLGLEDDWFNAGQSAEFLLYLLGNQGKNGIRDNVEGIQSFHCEIMESFKSFRVIHFGFVLENHLIYHELLSVIFEYVRVIKEKSFEELKKVFESYKILKKIMFDYLQINKPEEFVSIISENMQLFQREFYVTGFDVPGEFDYESFLRAIDQILNDFPAVSLSCSDFSEGFEFFGRDLKFEEFCEFYDMRYEIIDYEVQMQSFPGLDIFNSSLEFLSDLTVIHLDNKSLELKEKDENIEIWYQFDDQFNLPKATFSLFFTCEDWEDIEIDFEVKLKMVDLHLNYYETILINSGFSYSFEISHKGAVVMLNGWNQGLDQFLLKVLKILTSNSTEFQDESISNLLQKYSSFKHSQLFIQAFQVFADLIYDSQNEVDSKIKKLKQSKNFSDIFLEKFYLKVFIFGNVEFPETLLENIKNLKNLENLENPKNFKKFEKFEIFSGDRKRLSFFSDVNFCLFYWFDFGMFNVETWSQVLVLELLSNDLAFRVLRTQLQLGYVAFTVSSSKYKRNAIVLVLQGSDVDSEFADWKITRFWNEISFTEDEVQQAKDAIQSDLKKPKETFDEKFDSLWREIVFDRYLFEYDSVVSQAVQKVSLNDIDKLLEKVKSVGSKVFIKFSPDGDGILTRNKIV